MSQNPGSHQPSAAKSRDRDSILVSRRPKPGFFPSSLVGLLSHGLPIACALLFGISQVGSLSATGATPQSRVAPDTARLGNIRVTTSEKRSFTLSNSGLSDVALPRVRLTAGQFSIPGIAPPQYPSASPGGGACAIVFGPPGAVSGAGEPSVGSSGSSSPGAPSLPGGDNTRSLEVSPSNVSFGNVADGQTCAQVFVLTNTGTPPVTISEVSATGAEFSVSGLSLPIVLSAGASASFSVLFSPTTAGTVSGSVLIASDASDSPLTISLSGTGTASALSLSPSSLDFGSVAVGSSSTLPVVLTNNGATSVTVFQLTISGAGFSVSGPPLPVTLATGQNTSFSVTFDPTSAGSVTGALCVVSDAANSPANASLSALGVNKHSVALTWVASASPNIAGYNVYRGTVSGGPYTKLDSSLVIGTSYTDTTVEAGQTYYYVTTAVDSQGAESGDSNQATAVVPSL